MEKRFALRLICFVLPFVIIALLLSVVAILVGEAAPFRWVLQWQKDSEIPLAYQPAWTREQFFEYKLNAVAVHQPEVLLLGSSRMGAYRAAIANKAPERFYNASMSNMNIYEEADFFRVILEANYVPKVLIIGLDYVDFNAERGNFRSDRSYLSSPNLVNDLVWFYSGIRRVARRLYTDSQSMVAPTSENYQLLGIQSYVESNGYLWDGSAFRDWGDTAEVYAQTMIADQDYFEKRQLYFVSGSSLDASSLEALDSILRLANQHGVTVLAFLPPFHPRFSSQMEASSDFSYLSQIYPNLAEHFSAYPFPFYDFTNPASVGGIETEMIDAWHGMDLLSMRTYRELLRLHPELLGTYSDAVVLDEWINQNASQPLSNFSAYLP